MNPPDYGSATQVGRVRDHNEDSWLAAPDLGLWLVADGIGGQVAGEVASALAVEQIKVCVRTGMSLEAAIASANDAVLAAPQAGRGRAGMGTTVVALAIRNRHYQVAWLGDSRAYLWNSKGLTQLSRDHSYVQELVDSGEISRAQAAINPYRHIITRCIGSRDSAQVDVETVDGDLYAGDRLLLCSDGLTGELTDDVIKAVFDAALGVQETADQLVQAALVQGGSDNVTALIVAAPTNT